MAIDAEIQSSSQNKRGLVKKLGSCDRRIQGSAMALLRPWLACQKEMSVEELKKICKGIFYFLLNADKQINQGTLIRKLPSTVEKLDLNLARHYFQAFFMTIKREWKGVDLFRLDIFYLLLVHILEGMFPVVDRNVWDSKLVNGFLGRMTERSLLVVDKIPIQRMNFRFADGYLNEFQCVFPAQLETILPMIEPFNSVIAKGSNRLLLNRVDDNVFAFFLKNGQNLLKGTQGQDVVDNVENLGSIALSSRLSHLVTFPSTLQDNEKIRHDSRKEFKGLSKLLTPSGISSSLESIMMKLKMFRNISAEKSVDSKAISIEEIPLDSVSTLHSQHVKNIESNDQIGKPQIFENNISESLTRRCNEQAATGIVKSSENKSNAEAEEIQEFSPELAHKYTWSCQDAMNEVNGRERLELLDGESGDLEMTDVSVASDLEQNFEGTVLAGLENFTSPIPSLSVLHSPLQTGSKKRKMPQNAENELTESLSPANYDENEEEFVCSDLFSGVASTGKSAQRKVKRVRFSLKNNLVWKPYSPLPPESLRVPPSATPRGSALKKGVPPGPICIIKNSPRKKPALRQRTTAVRKSPKSTKSAFASSMVLRSQRPVVR